MIVHILGWAASAMVALSLSRKTIISLRVLSICSNFLFIAYALIKGDIWSVFILHSVLLPVNIVRLHQITTLINRVKAAATGEANLDALIPYMTLTRFPEGELLFEKGDKADKLFYIQSGRIKLVELNRQAGPGEAIGEIGVFSPYQERTATARCIEDVEAYTIDDVHIRQIFFQNPEFGYQLVQLIIKRMINYSHGGCTEEIQSAIEMQEVES